MKRSMILALFLVLAACEEKKPESKPEEQPAKVATATSAAVAMTAAPLPVTIADSDLSTPADFEETAEKAITKTNYKTELAALETAINKAETK